VRRGGGAERQALALASVCSSLLRMAEAAEKRMSLAAFLE
jgi:hypothetical protein